MFSDIKLEQEELDYLSFQSQSFAVCNGALIRLKQDAPQQITTPKALNVVPVPHTLTPAVLPRSVFNSVNSISTLLNTLVHKMSYDKNFIAKHLKETAHGDAEFTGKLYELFLRVQPHQTIQFGLHRSDYMMHYNQASNTISPQQVELNTISSAFGGLSTIAQRIHQFVYDKSSTVREHYAKLGAQYVPSPSLHNMSKAFAIAHETFNKQQQIKA